MTRDDGTTWQPGKSTLRPFGSLCCTRQHHLLMPPQAAFIGHFLCQTVIAHCWSGTICEIACNSSPALSLSIIGFALPAQKTLLYFSRVSTVPNPKCRNMDSVSPKSAGGGCTLPYFWHMGGCVGPQLKQFPVLGGTDSFLEIVFDLYKLNKVQHPPNTTISFK